MIRLWTKNNLNLSAWKGVHPPNRDTHPSIIRASPFFLFFRVRPELLLLDVQLMFTVYSYRCYYFTVEAIHIFLFAFFSWVKQELELESSD